MFCKNCGKELEDSSKFCKYCGAEQYSSAGQYNNARPYNNAGQYNNMNKKKPKTLVTSVIIALAAFMVFIVLCTLYAYGQEEDANNNSSNKGIELQADHSEDKGTAQDSTDVSDNDNSKQDDYEEITGTKISIDGKACSNSQAAYTYESSYGNMFMVLCPFSNNTIVLTAVVPRDMCESGISLSNLELGDKAILDLCIIGEMNSVEYASNTSPDVFSDMYFEMEQYTQDKEAAFIINTKFDYEGNTYSLEASAKADYTEYQENQSSASENTQDETCLYCHGSGRCFLCHGLGYTTWGGTQTECNSCGGLGSCYYCEGTGKQKYITRGYKKEWLN